MTGSPRPAPGAAPALAPDHQTRVAAFKAYAVTHPHLEATGTALMQALREPAGFAHVLLYGPTGVGKTVTSTISWPLFEAYLGRALTSFLAVSHSAWRQFHP